MLIVIAVLHIGFQLLRTAFPESDFIFDISNRFNVDDEVSLPTWYAIFLLLGLSATSYWYSHRAEHSRYWKIFAGITLLMSIDEGSGFHELLITPLRNLFDIEQPSLLYNAWIIVGVIIVAALAIALYTFTQQLSNETRLYMLLGFASYSFGILVIESIGGLTIGNERVYTTGVVLVEEMFEFVGLTLVWFGLLHEIEHSNQKST